MAQQTINIGTTPNDGTGDPLRTAFDKVNDNTTELYSKPDLTLASDIITLTRADGTTQTVNLAAYLDEDARAIASGTLNGATGIVTFTRDDATTFTLDLSDLLDDTNIVTSVNSQTGAVSLDTDDISQGTTNLYNQTHTGDVTGSTALTIANGAVTFTKLAGAAIVTEAEGIASNDNDTTLPTSAAVVDYVASQAGSDTTYTISTATESSTKQKITLTGSDSSTDDVILEAGGGIFLANSAGNIVITNSSQGSALNLSGGTGISVSGTWPNLTVTNTATDETLILNSGTGISVTGTYPNLTVTNSAPDQTVSLTQGGATTITGSYPNFTISSTDTNTFRTVTAGGNTLGASETLALTAGSNVTITESGGTVTISSTDTNTQLSTEQVQDIVGAMVSSNTESNITVTYDDATGKLNFSANAGDITGVSAGSGLSGGGTAGAVTISHADTSSAANLTASSRRYVTGLTFDTYGHVTGYSTGTETVVDTNTTYTNGAGLNLTGTTFSVQSDLRGEVFYIGRDTNDYYLVNTTTHDWRLDGNLDMRLENDGDLHVDGDVIAYSTTTSDRRLKDNITTIDSALEKVEKLRGVEYDWNATSRKGQHDMGVIAQEVEEVFPFLVREKKLQVGEFAENEQTFKTVDYEKLVGVLIESVKELSAEVKELKKQING